MNEYRLRLAQKIMIDFARDTGLDPPSKRPKRYLWTDAFAMCEFWELFEKTGDPLFKELALALVDQVHNVLGRHREDDERSGWISGLSEDEGRLHPTVGGLRIGKRLPERGPNDQYDPDLEWERDGQYFHYLTKWMHALNVTWSKTKMDHFLIWAVELAKTAHRAFTHEVAGTRLMYWKMSIDLSRPLVTSMGQHDPVDGLVTFMELDSSAQKAGLDTDLSKEISEMAQMCNQVQLVTEDPLGIGGLLFDATRTFQIEKRDLLKEMGELTPWLLSGGVQGLKLFAASSCLSLPAWQRLAFRELGLSIGLSGLSRMQKNLEKGGSNRFSHSGLSKVIEEGLKFWNLKKEIENFWLKEENRLSPTWLEHLDINRVMLAVSLFPDAFLPV